VILRQLFRAVLCLIASALLESLPSETQASAPKTLTILTAGNGFDPTRLATLTDSLRKSDRPLLVIHDAFLRPESVAWTRSYVSILQEVGVDVMTLSYFDLDIGPDALVQTFRRLPSPRPVCANLHDDRGHLVFSPYVVLKKGNLRIGFTSVMDSTIVSLYEGEPSSWQFSVLDPRKSLESALSAMKGKVDVVIVYSEHQDRRLETIPGIDLIITPKLWASNSEHTPSRRGFVKRVDLPLKGNSRVPVMGTVPLYDVREDTVVAERLRKVRGQKARRDPSWRLVAFRAVDLCCPVSKSVKRVKRDRFPTNDYDSVRVDLVPNMISQPGKQLEASLSQVGHSLSLTWNHPYADTIPRSPFDLYWRPPHMVKAELSPDHEWLSGYDGLAPPGSDVEDVILSKLRGAADGVFSWEEQDSLAQVCDLLQPEPVLQQRLAGLTPLEQHVAHLLGLVRFLESQRVTGLTEKPSYWHRRGIVYANLQCDATGKILAATLLENNAWPSAADSVLQLISAWPIPTQGHETHADLAWNQNVAFVVDRHETHLRVGDGVPGELQQKMDDKALAMWFKNLVDADSSITLADFIDTGPETLLMQSSKDLDAKEVKLRERLGIVRSAPGQRWKVDALPGSTIDSQGTVRLAETSGIRLISGKKETEGPLAWGVRDQEIDIAVWLDASHLAVAGWSPVDHPRISGKYVQFWVPTLWVLDVEARTMRRLQGPPLSPQAFQETWQGRKEVRDGAYPLVSWAQ